MTKPFTPLVVIESLKVAGQATLLLPHSATTPKGCPKAAFEKKGVTQRYAVELLSTEFPFLLSFLPFDCL